MLDLMSTLKMLNWQSSGKRNSLLPLHSQLTKIHFLKIWVDEITSVLTEKANATYALANGYCEGTDEDHNCNVGAGGVGDWGYVDVGGDSYYDGIRRVCEITGSVECEG